MTEVRMPQLGLTMTEGIVTRWFKQEGDMVEKGELLYEVETDKLTNEIESDAGGVLRKIVAPEGSEIPVLGLLAYVGEKDEPVPKAQEEAPGASTQPAAAPKEEAAAPPPAAGTSSGGRIKASPLAKKLAAQHGIDLSLIAGTGPGGRIVKQDVLAARQAPPAPKASVVQMPAGGVRREKMSAMRRAISKNMSHSWSVAPVVHYHRSADATKMTALKNSLSQNGSKISYTDILAKIVAQALVKHPYLNATVEGDDLIFYDYVNLGIAVALDGGLVVPVIQNAHQKGISALSEEIKQLALQARNGSLQSDQMSGGTFTITNMGMYGMESFTPIINQPESAILGVGSIVKTAVEVDGTIVMQPRMHLSLTADHRVIDGAVAAEFMQSICAMIEDPVKMLL